MLSDWSGLSPCADSIGPAHGTCCRIGRWSTMSRGCPVPDRIPVLLAAYRRYRELGPPRHCPAACGKVGILFPVPFGFRPNDFDQSHHAAILMIEDVAVIRKGSDNGRIAKVHPDLDLWISGFAI